MVDTDARCPISAEKIDESAARINGALVLTVLLLALVFKAPWLLGYLFLDFCLKLFLGFATSPNCWIARKVANALKLERKPVDSAPKRFAAIIAVSMSGLGLVMAYGVGPHTGFVVVVAIFAAFAALESLAGFCFGCYLYGLLPEKMSMRLVRTVRRESANG